ncbi:uncharacterized protein LOC127705678 isoform X1 [Mytilus californianus]|uniref:uncharacterized protein LOC127705678 isoform X1 n=1 Tax=Mytilus californianus TaxID=6549 RepID=UPI0022471627|nr:uncharacterized protein LOC127705678 isoform X1 [Mytilus californianus]
MATSSQSCGVCDLRLITKPCIIWCTECDEGLCKECHEHHSLSKASRNHSVIPFTDYQRLPTDVLKISQYCSKHNKKFEMFCQKHERPCCSKCIVETHKECRDIIDLDDVIKNYETPHALSEIEKTLVEVAENLQKIRLHQQGNMSTLKEKRKEIEKEIKKIRMEISNYLDKLQENFMKQLYLLEEKENSKIGQLLSSLEKKEKEVEECQKNIINIKQHATNLQMFLSVKQIEEDVSSKDKFLHSLFEGEDLNQHFLEFEINGVFQKVMFDIKSFGEVHIEEKPADIVLSRKKAKEAQIIVPIVQSRSIENIKMKINKKINLKGKWIYGCCMLPDGRLVFTYNRERKVRVFNNQGSKEFEMKIPCGAFDIVYISNDNTLVVTSGESDKQCLTIIDLERKEIKKTISLSSDNYGIVLKDNQLIYSAFNKGIRMINLYDESLSDIVREEMPSEGYLATFKNNIYHTNRLNHTVTCYNLQGEIQWTFKNEDVLKNPLGIDVDSDGNVYVAGIHSNNVVVISNDGKMCRELLEASVGFHYPIALRYYGLKKQLLVANIHDEARLFDLI